MKTTKLKTIRCVPTGSLILVACNNNVGGKASPNAATVKSAASQANIQRAVVKVAREHQLAQRTIISKINRD